ncbi:5-dehydro-4-deoxy-D-glucuronate isomerase [Flavobacterium gawalongense]|uniref:4-deoxy-L-threo-5-hexosulose-uronate ketol-isomerase n=1 Tax=Flavobacterium gawalongense TaxID=2594432 RepID=A0A553BSQ9_9FLAO|nr:5-dehydro-4-deoxy-D-glucuronate isomerase [Flavobacterium gawalongense]TRX11282.1 5-dehydro-4-deoxy-D-glucuronate isomerase [Flavobacterium gawalongense]TRX12257.1 5-dehydro-4-deoxy-D-glucuronate isomerase [Flavobacterium gawalongense]TRX30204.1 5-dehydro-4-deoxy-D-glucuronate isomerase [Flavobacterium gawalongense]
MKNTFEVRYASSPRDFKMYDTTRLREEFLIQNLMEPDAVNLVYTHYDRYIAGGAVPVKSALKLETIDPLKAEYFLERRELGIINVGGSGSVLVDGEKYELAYKEALYVGRENKEIIFNSDDATNPAKFYLNSAPAHKVFPTKKISQKEAEVVELGAMETANARTIRKLIVNSIVETCQVQMGMTELKPGSVWNTMPAHVHDRRMEVYFYFEVPEDQAVCHFIGEPQETRHIWMANNEAVISPPWSIHSGSATSNYTFIWGMAGENLDYGDMDFCKINELK